MPANETKQQYSTVRQVIHLPVYPLMLATQCLYILVQLHNENSRIKTFLLRWRLREKEF